jgi:hypothetical protein
MPSRIAQGMLKFGTIQSRRLDWRCPQPISGKVRSTGTTKAPAPTSPREEGRPSVKAESSVEYWIRCRFPLICTRLAWFAIAAIASLTMLATGRNVARITW